MKNLLLIFAVLVISFSCKDKSQQYLPQQSFTVNVNVNEPAFFDLSVPSGWVYYNAGVVKLILYRKTQDEFMAYDARSTYNIDAGCIVQVNADNVIIKDPCSASEWLITDGTVINGPATLSLLDYNTSFNSTTGELQVMN